MNKQQFLSELSRKLRRLPEKDYDDAMNYYVEFFLDAGVDDDTDVTPMVGSVDDVAAGILEECTDKQINKATTEGGVKNSTKAVWLIILGIFAAPIALPLAIAFAAVIFALLVTVFAVFFSLIIASAAIVFSGLVAIPAIFWAETTAQGMVLLGIVLVSIGLGVLMCIGFYKLGELIVKGIIKLIRHISRNRKAKRATKASNTETVNEGGEAQ